MKIIFALILLFCLRAGASGGTVGNGGGFARCADQKLYAYDYLITPLGSYGGDRQGLSLKQQFSFIGYHLHRLGDPLVQDFDIFVATMYKQVPGSPYQWFVRPDLPLMWEPGVEEVLPRSCMQRVQAVLFFARFDDVPYASYSYRS